MRNRNVTPFPNARQRGAFHRAKSGSFRPLPKIPDRSTIGWPTFIIITLAACSALFAAIWFSGGPPPSQSAAIDPHRARFGMFNDKDKYGRDLRVVTRGGKSLGARLVDEELAERWQGYRRDWC